MIKENRILRFLLSPTLWITIPFIFTGSINTLSVKWSYNLKSRANDISEPEFFRHPYLQTWGMFLGQSLCLLVLLRGQENKNGPQNGGDIEAAYKVGSPGQMQKFNPFILLPAAMLDLCGTSIMYVGLTMTSVSSFQMLRGSVIVFTGMLSRYEFSNNFKPVYFVHSTS